MPAKSHYPLRPGRWDALDRLMSLADALRASRPINATCEADARGLCRKTLMRDIDTLRRWGWVIEYDARERSYVLISAPRPRLF